MTQLVVTLKDQSYLPNIRRILKSLVGVEKVTTAKTGAKPAARKKRLSRYEQSLLDLEEGRVNSLVMGTWGIAAVIPKYLSPRLLLVKYIRCLPIPLKRKRSKWLTFFFVN